MLVAVLQLLLLLLLLSLIIMHAGAASAAPRARADSNIGTDDRSQFDLVSSLSTTYRPPPTALTGRRTLIASPSVPAGASGLVTPDPVAMQFEAMPGGLAGVRAAVDELHAAGVRVLIPYNPWDIGTRRCGAGECNTVTRSVP